MQMPGLTDIKMNEALLPRFGRGGESWQDICGRVAGILPGCPDDVRAAMNGGRVVPAGQILRGAGRPGAVLFNSYATGVAPGERASDVAHRITDWTAKGIGVGVNITPLLANDEHSITEVVDVIGRSQDRLWLAGTKRTATMLVVDFGAPGVAEAARRMAHLPELRHLNLAVNLPNVVMQSLALGSTSLECQELRNLLRSSLDCGNPGFVFIDRVNCDSLFDERLDTCNACAEQFLRPNEGTPLCSINLAALVKDGVISSETLDDATDAAVRLLDSALDASAFPSPVASAFTRRRRRIGVGVMGLDSALRRMSLAYDSDKAVQISSYLARNIRFFAEKSSQQLAAKLGPFAERESGSGPPRRNAGLLSVAPTGGISALWGVSSGIEPIFGRRVAMETVDIDVDVQGDLPLKDPGEIHWQWHLKHLAAWQSHVDGGVSKTVNLPPAADADESEALLIEAWRLRVKSVSIFRTGCRPAAIRVL